MSGPFEVRPFGQSAVLITGKSSLLGYRYALQDFGHVRAGMVSLLIEGVDPRRISEIEDRLGTATATSDQIPGAHHDISVYYDGEDLSSVAERLGISIQEVISTHSSVQWRVAMVGFSPGFAYLTTEETSLFDQLPRLELPRPKVPAGALALAAGMSAIYPTASPGGWHLIGSSDVTLFNPRRASPSLLAAGDLVRFTT